MYNLSSKTQRTAKDNLMDQANALVKNARIKGCRGHFLVEKMQVLCYDK